MQSKNIQDRLDLPHGTMLDEIQRCIPAADNGLCPLARQDPPLGHATLVTLLVCPLNAPPDRSSYDYQNRRRFFVFARLYGREHPALLRRLHIREHTAHSGRKVGHNENRCYCSRCQRCSCYESHRGDLYLCCSTSRHA